MTVVQSVQADIDGDGQLELVEGLDDFPPTTRVSKNGQVIWQIAGWIDGWNRRSWDIWTVSDIDSDGSDEIVIANNRDGYTGYLRWTAAALHCPWGSPSPLVGPAGEWNRHQNDKFSAIQYDGAPSISIENMDAGGLFGILQYQSQNGALAPVSIIERSGTFDLLMIRPDPNLDLYSATVVDGQVPPGARVSMVTNMNRGTDPINPNTVSMHLTHEGYDPNGHDFGPMGSPTSVDRAFFAGQLVVGSWIAVLTGTNIDDNAGAWAQIEWRL